MSREELSWRQPSQCAAAEADFAARLQIALAVALIAILGFTQARGDCKGPGLGRNVSGGFLLEDAAEGFSIRQPQAQWGAARVIVSAHPIGSSKQVVAEEFDGATFGLVATPLLAGRRPDRPGEIVIEEHLLEDLGLDQSDLGWQGAHVRLQFEVCDRSGRPIGTVAPELIVVGLMKNNPASLSAGGGTLLAARGTVRDALPDGTAGERVYISMRQGVDPVAAALGWVTPDELSTTDALARRGMMWGPTCEAGGQVRDRAAQSRTGDNDMPRW